MVSLRRAVAIVVLGLTAGCPVSRAPTIPDDVQAACAAFPGADLSAVIEAVTNDHDNGVPREESFAAFENGCRTTQPDDSFIQACLICGNAVYDLVYGPATSTSETPSPRDSSFPRGRSQPSPVRASSAFDPAG